jgi:hypothetical protein
MLKSALVVVALVCSMSASAKSDVLFKHEKVNGHDVYVVLADPSQYKDTQVGYQDIALTKSYEDGQFGLKCLVLKRFKTGYAKVVFNGVPADYDTDACPSDSHHQRHDLTAFNFEGRSNVIYLVVGEPTGVWRSQNKLFSDK